jgi:hypothetical protein
VSEPQSTDRERLASLHTRMMAEEYWGLLKEVHADCRFLARLLREAEERVQSDSSNVTMRVESVGLKDDGTFGLNLRSQSTEHDLVCGADKSTPRYEGSGCSCRSREEHAGLTLDAPHNTTDELTDRVAQRMKNSARLSSSMLGAYWNKISDNDWRRLARVAVQEMQNV